MSAPCYARSKDHLLAIPFAYIITRVFLRVSLLKSLRAFYCVSFASNLNLVKKKKNRIRKRHVQQLNAHLCRGLIFFFFIFSSISFLFFLVLRGHYCTRSLGWHNNSSYYCDWFVDDDVWCDVHECKDIRFSFFY